VEVTPAGVSKAGVIAGVAAAVVEAGVGGGLPGVASVFAGGTVAVGAVVAAGGADAVSGMPMGLDALNASPNAMLRVPITATCRPILRPSWPPAAGCECLVFCAIGADHRAGRGFGQASTFRSKTLPPRSLQPGASSAPLADPDN
jgi:hypothetical protein